MNKYVKRVETITAYIYDGDWKAFVEEVRPPKFKVEHLDAQGNPATEHTRGLSVPVQTQVTVWLYGATEWLTIRPHETLVRSSSGWSVMPTREFLEVWVEAK